MKTNRTLILMSALTIVAAGAATLLAQSTLSRFGVNVKDWQQESVSTVVNGYSPSYPDRKQFRAASPAIRAAFVKEAMSWAKAYTESAAFLEQYRKERERAKPTPPQSKGTPDEQYAKQMAEQRKSVEEMKQNVAKMAPDMQKKMADTVKQMEAMVEHNAKDPQMAAMMKQAFAQQSVADQQDYQRRMSDYEKRYPADPKALITKRLRDFLDMSKDIAFDAKLVAAGGGAMKFADPQYESKSDQWKLCYRAGKDAVQAGRAFATDWLRQLPAK